MTEKIYYKSNLGIFQQRSEYFDDCEAYYISYPNFEKAVAEILEREKAIQVQAVVKPEIADIEFLVNRTMKAGTCNFSGDRDTGTSSNSIVAIAYGIKTLEEQILPSDMSDLMACRNMWEQLPEHRKTESAEIAMDRAINFR